jgi:hypothetical protein
VSPLGHEKWWRQVVLPKAGSYPRGAAPGEPSLPDGPAKVRHRPHGHWIWLASDVASSSRAVAVSSVAAAHAPEVRKATKASA